jgi:hypothetical protein
VDLSTNIPGPVTKTQPTRRRFPSGGYSMIGDDRAKALAGADMPSYVRLMFACFAKANVNGHCPFAPGEMKKTLGGEAIQRSAVRWALCKLISQGIAAPESTTRCVVLDASLYSRGDNRPWTCQVHGERSQLKWVHGLGWELKPGSWDKWLGDPRTLAAIQGVQTSCTA